MARPMLGDLDLEQVQMVETDEDQVVTHHPVPALDAGFLQRLGRRGARLRLTGVLTKPDTLASLGELRARFLEAAPVPFVSDISTATLVGQVLVEHMEVRELAGRPARLEYAFTLREFTPAEPVTPEPTDFPTPPLPSVDAGALSVTVVVDGEPAFDFDRVTVQVRGTEDDDARPLDRFLTTRTGDNVWLEDPFPAGSYTVEARVADEEALTGSASTRVENGEVAEVRIVLRRGAMIGTVFVIHFRFDNAFVEPCMRTVLRRVAEHASAHPDEKLLVVGHTDLVGSDAYNQSLSERRSRAAYAYLTFGRDAAAAVNEWNELRRARPAGVLPSARDTWGTREYQHILADLGYFRGNIGADPDLTDAAVRRFQADNGLADDGVVGDDTWPVLITAYLSQDSLAIPEAQLLPNAADGCDEGRVRWLGCNEQDPVLSTQDAWRPNRRTELMFVKEDELPCPVPRPVTLGLVPDGAGGGGWCLDDGTASAVCCFVAPADSPCPPGESQRWCRRPAEEGSFTVQGRVEADDGSPMAGARYVLTAPDGEFMDGEVKVTTSAARAGTPHPGRTGADGGFRYDRQKGPGTYTFEIEGPFVARLEGQPPAAAKGNTVCARLDGSRDLVVVVTPRAALSVSPAITGPDAVVVPRPSTNPARQPVTLRASEPFTGTGTLTRSDDRIRFFPAAAGGTELAFDGSDNVFTDAQLAAGHTVFAEGVRASDAAGDVTLTLALTVGGAPGLVATHPMTAVELTLDVGLSRPAPGVDPPVLPAADKVPPGRPLQAQDPLRGAERAMLLVRPPRPGDFAGDLALASVNGRVRLHATEVPAPGDAPLGEPNRIPAGTVPPAGLRLFAEGVTASAAPGDAGVQLGIDGVEADGDRVAITVVQIEATADGAAAAPALTAVQVGLWDDAFDPATGDLRNGEAAAANFVDLDTRNFHVRVRDPRQAGEVSVGWRTEFDDGTGDDTRPFPFSDQLSLTETAAGSGVFVSRAVMLVADEDDRDQAVNSGLPAPHPDAGDRGFGDSNHRLRRITVDDTRQLTSRVAAEYPVLAGVDPFTVRVPVFERDPEERRRIRVHLVDVRDAVGGTGTLTLLRQVTVEATIRAAYAACGIYADIDVIELDPPASAVAWTTDYPTDPIAADPSVEESSFPGGVNLVASASEEDVIAAVRALAGFDADDVHLVMVRRLYATPLPAPPGPGLAVAAGGEAFPDAWTAAGATARGFAFVAVDSVNEFADPHEMTHITTDLRNVAGGHFDLGPDGAAAPGNIDGKNLMHRFALVSTAGTGNSKRLWDRAFTNTQRVPNLVVPAQITSIRASRFVRAY